MPNHLFRRASIESPTSVYCARNDPDRPSTAKIACIGAPRQDHTDPTHRARGYRLSLLDYGISTARLSK